MTKFDTFYNYSKGKAWDKYGKSWNVAYATGGDCNFAGQCVSLVKTYLLYLYGNKVKDSYGDAKDYWYGRKYNGILDLFNEASDLKNGDIVVSTGSDARYGHIFIYKDGQAFTQNCCNNPKASMYPLSWQGTITGILRPKVLISNFDLIPEHRIAKVKPDHEINIRVDNPVGRIVRTAKTGTEIEYTEKCVCYGHRYISWIENGKRLFMAVTPTEKQKDHWVDISSVKSKFKGVDISNYQPNFDCVKAKKDIDFAILRCGFATTEDLSFMRHIKEAKKAGVDIRAIYLFTYALNMNEVLAEADFAVECAKKAGLPKSTVIFFDMEGASIEYAKKQGINLTSSDVQKFTRAFMDRVKSHGYKTGYYTNLDWSKNKYNGFKKKSDELFWFARYNANPELTYDVLQYTSSGSVNGNPGPLDMNYWVTSKPSKPAEKPKEVWDKNAIVKVGSTVKSTSCSIAVVPGTNSAFRNNCVYIPALGGLVPLEDVTEAADTRDGKNDDVISTLASRVYLNPSKVTAVNAQLNLCMVNGYWVNAEPLMVKK